jgi:hypothetical protein
MTTASIETGKLPNGEDFIVLRGTLGEQVVRIDGTPEEEPGYRDFQKFFEVDPQHYLGDPHEQHRFGTTFTRLIRRRSDGAVFGATFHCSPGEPHADETFGDSRLVEKLGVEWAWMVDEELPIVFLPVRQFVRIGYELIRP